jgi:hypothetical protein
MSPYGSWIDTRTGEVHDVMGEQQHREYIRAKWVEVFGREYDPMNGDGLLSTPLSVGFIRATYKNNTLNVEGDERFLKAGFPVLKKLAQSFATVMIDIHDTGDWLSFNVMDKKDFNLFVQWGRTPSVSAGQADPEPDGGTTPRPFG